MFKLGKSEFKIEDAGLNASFTTWDDAEDTEFVWHLDIEMEEGTLIWDEEEMDEEGMDEELSPSLYHNNGFRVDVRSWKQLEGISLEWEEAENDNGEEAGYVYMGYHAEVTEGKIEFLKRTGNKYLVRWTGLVEDEVPFEFEGEVEFTGILADSDSITSLEELIPAMMEFIDMDEFECVSQSSYDNTNGERHRWMFAPKDVV